jgi:hypothetical protein
MSSAERAAYNTIAGSVQVNLLITEDMPGQAANGRHTSLLERSKSAQKAVASLQEDLRCVYFTYCDVYYEVRLSALAVCCRYRCTYASGTTTEGLCRCAVLYWH